MQIEQIERHRDPDWKTPPAMGVPNSVQDYEMIFNQWLQDEAAYNKYSYSRLKQIQEVQQLAAERAVKNSQPRKTQTKT